MIEKEFEIIDIHTKPFCDFFVNINDLSESKKIEFYNDFGLLCAENDMENFIMPFVGSNYNSINGRIPKVLLIAESKYIDIRNQAEDYREAGRDFFNWVLNFMVKGIKVKPSESIKDFIETYKYTIFNQEPIISYIKVRGNEIDGCCKMRKRDYRGWPFPFLIRAMNQVFGYEGSKKRAELDRLKQIAFVNYFQIPFIVENNNNGFKKDNFIHLAENYGCTWEKYCSVCDSLLDAIIDILQPDIIIFASKKCISYYNGKNKDRMKTIHHPASWFLNAIYNDREELKNFLSSYNNS